MQKIGTIELIRRYPVKSMKGEDLDAVFVSYIGLRGDRIYAFVDETNTSNFPWMTARQISELLLYKPRFIKEFDVSKEYPDMENYDLEVEIPEGKKWNIRDPEFKKHLEEKFSKSLRLRFSEKGMWDSRPISLFSTDTLRTLEKEIKIDLDYRRFRANFYVKWDNGEPFFEDKLVGKTLQIGEKLKITISKKDPRCVIITYDPETTEKNTAILPHIATRHENCAGVYGVVLQEGIVRKRDEMFLI
ncbi:MAG: MOSC domain containing protein [Parcubacteria group bacterium Gr01-1014_33]|nr:MAG: MOSC domain containing protein [Parcubacteria group bacterium Gr01-1014_33]